MNWNKWVRQFHRGLSVAFTVLVVANIVLLIKGEKGQVATWVGFVTLLPLSLLLFTGLYLFVLPYASKWRSRRRTAGSP